MSNELTIPQQFEHDMKIAEHFSKSGYFKEVRDVSKAFVKIQAGRELGVSAFCALQNIDFTQDGRLLPRANLFSILIKKSGKYSYLVKTPPADREKECTIDFFNGNTLLGTATYDIGKATRAGLIERKAWKDNKTIMLFNRCLYDGVRMFVADIMSGQDVAGLADDEVIHAADYGLSGEPETPAQKSPEKNVTPPPEKSEQDEKISIVKELKKFWLLPDGTRDEEKFKFAYKILQEFSEEGKVIQFAQVNLLPIETIKKWSESVLKKWDELIKKTEGNQGDMIPEKKGLCVSCGTVDVDLYKNDIDENLYCLPCIKS